ncbi:toxin-antitoxin system YwqK family antitoxin [Spirosoma soli]|uniref:Toxin-antitoxin system YwqK family antitoxin n=1 Tax=Spirosoma soli TaxID=1770529 RepID=A0ABW5M1J9_9BACT
MKMFIVIALLLLTQPSLACICNDYTPFDNVLFKKYKYIAYVRIKSFEPFSIAGLTREEQQSVSTAKFTVDVLENYKAPVPDTLLLEGYRTSCDMGLRPGEEWLVLANDFHNYATVFPCSRSFQYRDKNGKRDLAYQGTEKALNILRQAFGIKQSVPKDGLKQSFYPTGQIEYKEFYKNGRLEGERLYWYPNGQLWGHETYVDGLKDGIAEVRFDDGHLARKEKYKAGSLVDTSQSWYEKETYLPSLKFISGAQHITLDSAQRLYGGHQLLNVSLYNQQGHETYSKSYYRTGRLLFESISFPDKAINYTTHYQENGNIQYTSVSEQVQSQRYGSIRQTIIEIDYNEDGTRKGFYYDRKGRLIRRTLVRDGVETIAEEKHYNDSKD